MFDAIKAMFTQHRGDPGAEDDPRHALQVAACVLLLEIAHADDEFTEEERRNIEEALVRHFDLPPAAAGELMALAETQRRETADLYPFTSRINASYDDGQRLLLFEILWRIVYADGRLSEREDYLLRKLAVLLQLRPGYLAEARKRAEGQGRTSA